MTKTHNKHLLKPVIFILIIVGLIIISRTLGLGQKLGELKNWIMTIGIWGPIVFIFLYAIATVATIPGSALTLAAGSMFGSVLGVIVVSIASTFGASLAFLVGRYIARDSVSKWLSNKEKFKKLDDLTKKHGNIIVAITRLVPLFPFNLLNYGFGLTNVSFKVYVFWSWLCMLPGTVIYVVGADVVTKAMTQGKIPWFLIIILIIVIIVITIIANYIRKYLREKGKNEHGI